MGNFLYQQLYKEKKFSEVFQGLKDSVLKDTSAVNPWDFYFFCASAIEINAKEINLSLVQGYLDAKEKSNDKIIFQKAFDRIEGLIFKLVKGEIDKINDNANINQIRPLFKTFYTAFVQFQKRNDTFSQNFYLEFSLIEFLKIYLKIENELDMDKPLMELVNCFNYSSFSKDTYNTKNPKNQKDIVLASKQEKFFYYKAKLLNKLKRYQEAIDFINLAFSTITSFHESIDVSLKRLLSRAYLGLENHQKAIDILIDLLKEKQEWYIYQEIGDAYLRFNQLDLALIYFIKAYFIYIPEMSTKVNLIHRLADAFLTINHDLSITLYLQEVQLRKSKDWPISEELTAKTSQVSKIPISDIDTILLDYLYSKNNRQTGTVIKILPNGKSGFIDQHYFSFKSFVGHPNKIKLGVRVDYIPTISQDKTGKPSKEAIHIRLSK